ncbi:hypothetical protein M438DRAFT_341309 [Aureobasidium pullulans EXF-150]|uniref:Uncharacterized protein n=1 Tax=Aureobasidium pullulans EXF-150 TaxID=1043002 RepID=A0A074XVQ5_AURPU|nr:uncharacterized protein M438DRAFT_341309 [Aureobasidium pullulans EXF-150]KEQ89570.1 hypothetical protein M438DRAFT_341309 [Aureobasidium pullulans EXF-150]
MSRHTAVAICFWKRIVLLMVGLCSPSRYLNRRGDPRARARETHVYSVFTPVGIFAITILSDIVPFLGPSSIRPRPLAGGPRVVLMSST